MKKFDPEPGEKPFHTRLLGEGHIALFSFIHSLNTNFGSSIFEPVALTLAEGKFLEIERQKNVGEEISGLAQVEIQKIIDNLTLEKKPDKKKEIEAIRRVCQQGEMRQIKPTKVDIFLERKSGEMYLFDLKTAKPNKDAFKGFKRTLLEWVAIVFAQNPQANINTLIAIPYNPYAPKPYSRWTMAGMLDLAYELKVAEDFWDFLGGKGTYKGLLTCFEEVGYELRDEVDEYFSRYKMKI